MNIISKRLNKLIVSRLLGRGLTKHSIEGLQFLTNPSPLSIGTQIFFNKKHYFSLAAVAGMPRERDLISNPEKIPKSRKILKDLYINMVKPIEHFQELIGASDAELAMSLKALGIELGKKTKLKIEEMELLALEYDCILAKEPEKGEFPLRPPIITIMGHVDHGKTTLLDCLRNSNIAEGEFGGITQKIGAFMVKNSEGKLITFIDTPGHEAFSNMRKRGSLCTDIVILVVSAIDGCQPQTFEAIEHAKRAGVPIIVAVNKIDKGGNPEEVEDELYEYGLNIEPKGGNVPVIHISAKFKKNIDLLEELILFEAELMELRADPDSYAEGMILESKRSHENEAKACTVVVQQGTLKVGDYIVAGTHYGKVRQLKDDRGNFLKEAPPSYAVELYGLKELPNNGDVFFVVSDETRAKLICHRRQMRKEFNEKNEKEENIKGTKIKFSQIIQRSGDKQQEFKGKKKVSLRKQRNSKLETH